MRSEVYSKSSLHEGEERNRSGAVRDSCRSEIHPFGRSLIEGKPLHSVYCTVRRIDTSPHASMMKDLVHSVQTTFCIHLIATSGPQRRPKVRMLFAATAGDHAVYEAQGSWSKCIRCIQRLPSMGITKLELATAKKQVGLGQYATLPLVRASFLDLESLGLQRVDR
jgi:hypothetical protein